ncbi:hypothetical protein ABT095_01720 [Kitasatospora sp. NPDC002227]|uniref:hypothetical protein n=1 Tax=Kitasatospora sp. NPDC002227 TaxID=3154773 RepID=UPI003333EAB7
MSTWTVDARGNGTFTFDVGPFPAGVINRHSNVFASICELSQPSGEPLDFPFLGAATMTVDNIAPQDSGHVLLYVSVNWGSPLNFRIHLAVL